MKQLLTITLLIIAVVSKGQTHTYPFPNLQPPQTMPLVEHISPDWFVKTLHEWQHSDTLTITDTSIHFIKIGDKVFEVKRIVDLKPVFQIEQTVPLPLWNPAKNLPPAYPISHTHYDSLLLKSTPY